MPLQIDVRFIAATNRKLQEEVEAGRFREDLYYRLNVVQLTIPPLRQRNGDIPALSRHLLARIATQPGLRSLGITAEALNLLMAHPWPGNVRQLQNALFRRSEEHTSELQTLMRISYAVFCLNKKTIKYTQTEH